MNDNKFVIAVDIGGTKISVAVITLFGDIIAFLTEPTTQKGPDFGINQIILLIEKIIIESKIEKKAFLGIGIGIPAVLELETDFIKWAPNLTGWKDVDLKTPLNQHFKIPVAIEYDGHMAALGEWWLGSSKNSNSSVCIVIGTGIGGGIIVNNQLVRGGDRLAGAVGWFTIADNLHYPNSIIKNSGIWEGNISGPAIERIVEGELKNNLAISTLLSKKLGSIRTKDVFDAAKLNDEYASSIVARVTALLAKGIANIVSLLNPEVIVLGGSVGANLGFVLNDITMEMKNYTQPYSARSVEIRISSLGNRSVLLGAAYGIIHKLTFADKTSKLFSDKLY